jgi:hypothetical protein
MQQPWICLESLKRQMTLIFSKYPKFLDYQLERNWQVAIQTQMSKWTHSQWHYVILCYSNLISALRNYGIWSRQNKELGTMTSIFVLIVRNWRISEKLKPEISFVSEVHDKRQLFILAILQNGLESRGASNREGVPTT